MAVDVDAAKELRERADPASGDAADGAERSDAAAGGGRTGRPGARRVIASGLVMVSVLAALVGWLSYREREIRQADDQRQLFVQVARQAAVNLTTISFTRSEADVQRILDSATGAFHDEFQQRSAAFIDVIKKAQSTTEGTVTEAALETEAPDRARVMVAVTVKTSNAGQPDPSPRAWRMRIDVQRVGGGAKVSNVEFAQ